MNYFHFLGLFSTFKIFCFAFSFLFVANHTQLGDVSEYLSGTAGGFGFFAEQWWFHSTKLMNVVSHGLNILSGEVVTNLIFIALSIYGIFYSTFRFNLKQRQIFLMMVLLLMPSFSIWTSMVSKESVLVFSYGVLLGSFFDWYHERRVKNIVLCLLSLYLAFLFKPHYTLAIFVIFIYFFIVKYLDLNKKKLVAVFIVLLISVFFVIFLMKDYFNWLAAEIPKSSYFDPNARSTRINDFWVFENDIFTYAPVGMLVALWGPTIKEMFTSFLHLAVFIESTFIFTALILFVYQIVKNVNYIGDETLGLAFAFALGLIAIAIVHYPFGMMNPGTAIRYRSGFYGFYVVFAFFVNSKISQDLDKADIVLSS